MSCSLSCVPKQYLFLTPPFVLALSLSAAAAEEIIDLEPVKVIAEPESEPAVGGSPRTNNGYQVNSEGINLWGAPGGSNPYSASRAMPSVNAQSADAYGLTNLPGGTKGLRVRGELATHGSRGTVDGIPLGSVNPGPGYLWLFDVENFSSVTLQQGAATPDQASLFTTAGALDSRLRWPGGRPQLHMSQAWGSSTFSRTQARLDSGRLPSGGAAFISTSHTIAEKWRGYGDSPGGRDNVAVALTQPLGESLEVKAMAAYNDMKAHNYRALSYKQAMDLDGYGDYDFSDDPGAASSYFDYNRQSFKDWTLLAEASWQLSTETSLVFKPYYLDEQGYYLDGQVNGHIREWLIDHTWYGMTTELHTKLAETGIKVGYWRQSSSPPGPPTAWKMYTPTSSGDLSGSVTWNILSKVTERHLFDNLYLMAERELGNLRLEGGVRYLRETLPGIDAYDPSGLGNLSYSQALSQSKGVISERSVESTSVDAVLPYLGVSYALSPAMTLKASLGRNYGAPSFDVWPVYQKKADLFLSNGITANDLWKAQKPELSEALDLGMRFDGAQFWLEPSLYLARFHDKKVSFDSDGSGSLPTYSQNVGETRAWGAQLAGSWTPVSNLDLFGGLSWNRNEFIENLPVLEAADLNVKGRQIPDTPIWMANLGLTWHTGGFNFAPIARYTGARYGDTEHTQRIPAFTTLDLNLGYQHRLSFGKLNLSFSVINLFDRDYISVMRSGYYQLLSGGSAIYYPGAPRTLMAKIAIDI